MNNVRSKSKEIVLVAAFGIASWYGGSYYEKNKLKNQFPDEKYYDLKKIENMPGLPVFGTVSAATVISPSENRLVPSPNRTSQIMKYGFPSLDQVRSFDDFVLSYDRRTKVANWVFEHLTSERLEVKDNVDRSKCAFIEDESIHKYFRATNNDYKKSGFDRGHLAAAGNHRLEQRHCDQTFYLTNIAPQVGEGFNRHSWNRLEKRVRKLARTYKNVYVCTGPLYLAKLEPDGKKYVKYQVIGTTQVAVPTHFFKIVVMETEKGEFHLESYIMPNQALDDNTPLQKYYAPPENIEMSSGLLFFDRLARERLVKINGLKSTFV